MVGVILVFIGAHQSDTIWDLHLYPFGQILPYCSSIMIMPTMPGGESYILHK